MSNRSTIGAAAVDAIDQIRLLPAAMIATLIEAGVAFGERPRLAELRISLDSVRANGL